MKIKVNTDIEIDSDFYCSENCKHIKNTLNYCRLFDSPLSISYFDEQISDIMRINRCDCCRKITMKGN